MIQHLKIVFACFLGFSTADEKSTVNDVAVSITCLSSVLALKILFLSLIYSSLRIIFCHGFIISYSDTH